MHTLITKMRAGLLLLCVPADSVQLFTSAPVTRTISRTEAPEGPEAAAVQVYHTLIPPHNTSHSNEYLCV